MSKEEAIQAKLDSVMLEFCPEEMGKEQLENWEKRQVPVSAEVQAEVEAAINAKPDKQEKDRRPSHSCSGASFPHVPGSLRRCVEHPDQDKAVLATPRSTDEDDFE